ncbi:molybdopterin molybdotransferase MoeA [Helicobacter mustelae]|uniref:Molybdopterin molybdenumtransferase n=1 Tax=Helicobacter mustelae (strain ATCC 43772 / CCUG 25715 / CIP 103759 / LMG 18044 / NCTC 12198 / R85-136P) TaxID=679897 RepID=D3UJA1_HELM1|nr:molybdopterin molybdotransferase MoeA [Helicobacter mustelae]CBG40576.1 putative molybdopterin biosynthesis protein [Helicobacter mustelae 12198]SQH72073.1 molybdopterin biosynthesis protein [Helicobacter mustelae]STP13217.1 molybdopterin biosynthesis protein [Helicobacter mustelae]
MLELQDAIKINFSLPRLALKSKICAIYKAQGRLLARDYFITRPLPLFDNSAMDGYALKSTEQGETLFCRRRIFAGDDASDRILEPKEAIAVMTGAMIPQGADVVVPIEQAVLEGEKLTVPRPLAKNSNIRKKGEEKQAGALIAKRGERLDFGKIGLLASQGYAELEVRECCRIGVFSSGNEILEVGENARGHQIYNINAPSICALLENYDLQAQYLGILPDDFLRLESRLLSAVEGHDILITSGGASVGDADFFEKILQKNHAEIFYHKLNIKPGKPLMVARLKNCYIFCLPGNPLSGILNLLALLVPTIFYLSGARTYYPKPIIATLKEDLYLKGKRAHMILGDLREGVFTPYQQGKYSPNAISTFGACNSLVLIDHTTEYLQAGQKVGVLQYIMEFDEENQGFVN